MPDPVPLPVPPLRCTARALLLGERIDTAGLERSDVISTAPLALRVGSTGFAVLFHSGSVVLVRLSPIEGDEALRGIRALVAAPSAKHQDHGAILETTAQPRAQIV